MNFTSETKVKQSQVDELGHLNHVFALQILEYARDDWYAQAGLWQGRPWSGNEVLATLVLNVNYNYRLECFLDETLKVVTSPLNRGNKSFTLTQEIIKADRQVAIDGNATSLVMDMEKHITVEVPACLAQYLPRRKKTG